MSWVQLQDITFGYEGSYENVFESLSLGFDTDWKLGLIGRNGRGKTTLMRILLGQVKFAGQVQASVECSGFPFDLPIEERAYDALREAIAPYAHWEREMQRLLEDGSDQALASYSETLSLYQANDGYLIDALIEKEVRLLNMDVEVLDHPLSTLSGGERTKIMLAALFLRKNHFLLIDEPTNHLDLHAREAVVSYLANKRGYLVISHDRWFLDQVVDHIMSINKTGIIVEQGNYSSWRENKRKADAYEIEKNQHLEKEIAKLEESQRQKRKWSDHIEAGKIGSHTADRGRVGHLAAKMMQRAINVQTNQQRAIDEKKKLLKDIEYAPWLKLTQAQHFSKTFVTLRDAAIAYDGRTVFHDLTLHVQEGERVALIGPNGCGKTSLLRVILGQQELSQGHIRLAPHLEISYVWQSTSHLQGALGDYVQGQGIDLTRFLTLLRKLDFRREDFDRPMERMSDGQKKKVLIAASLCSECHLFLWDEPLNYIDILSREQIEELLQDYQPTMLFVEHDKRFIETIATKVVDMGKYM